MIFEVHDTYVIPQELTLVQRNQLKEMLAAKPDGYQFMPRFKRGTWDGNISLYKDGRFPTGLLELVLEDEDFANAEVVDHRHNIQPGVYELKGIEYRPYQQQAIEVGLKYGDGIFRMATNAGKTLVIAGLLKAIGGQAVVIVPGKNLLRQTGADLANMMGCEVGLYGDGNHRKETITVTTINSLERLVADNDLRSNEVVIIDECHHTGAKSLFDHIFFPGRYRFGFSGTPITKKKLHDLRLIAATGPVRFVVTNKDLIKWGYSTPPLIRWITINTPQLADDMSFQRAYKIGIVENVVRNWRIAEVATREAKLGPVLIIVEQIKHLRLIADLIPVEANLIALTGKDKKATQIAGLEKFNEEGGVLLSTPIFGEGMNMPAVSSIILGSGWKSHVLLLQRIGRGLRKHEGKERVLVYDFLDDIHKTLFKHSNKRYNLYKREGFQQEMTK